MTLNSAFQAKLFLFFLLTGTIFAQPEVVEWPASAIDPEPEGDCPGISLRCMPYKKLSFREQVWKDQPQEYWIKELNKELKSKKFLKKRMYVRNSTELQFTEKQGIFFSEKVKKGDVLGEFDTKKLITSELNAEGFKGKPYYSEHRKIFSEFRWFGNGDAVLRLTLNILYHLYHIDDSPVAADLRALPQTVDMFGFTANRYELETLLKNDISSSFINVIRNRTMYEYAYLKSYLKKSLSRNEMASFLNGRKEIPADDFVYATSIVYQRSVSDQLTHNNETKYFYFIPFATHNAKVRDQKLPDGGYVKTQIHPKTGEYTIEFVSNDDYEKGDEFLIDYFITENFRMLAIHGIAYKDNIRECLKLKFLDDERMEKYQLPSEPCVEIVGNHLSKYYMVGDYENMSQEEKDECDDIILQYTNDPVARTKAFMEKCPHPNWTNLNMWKDAHEILEMYLTTGKAMIMQAESYIGERNSNNMSCKRGEAILAYAHEKVKNANSIKGDIAFYEDLPRTNIKGKKIKKAEEL